MLSIQKRINCKYLTIFVLFCIQLHYAQNRQINMFFETKKKISYEHCIKESEIDKIKNTPENKEIIALMIKGCQDRGLIFNNFIDGSTTLLSSLPIKEEDFIIFNWKVHSPYIPAPTVTMLEKDTINVVEFTYYDEKNNKYDSTLIRRVYKEKEGKFKEEIQYIKNKLKGEKENEKLSRYGQNDYYVIKRIKGKYFFYTLINDKLKQVQ